MSQFSRPSGWCWSPLLLLVSLAVPLSVSAQRNGVMKVSVTVRPSCQVSADTGPSPALAGVAQVVCAAHTPFHASLRQTHGEETGVAADAEAVMLPGTGRLELPANSVGSHTVMRLTVAY